MVGGLVHLHQAHVLAAGDRNDDALGALHRDAVEQRIGDRLLGGLDRPIVAAGFAGAHHCLTHLAHHRADVGEVEVDQAGHDHQVGDPADALLKDLVRHHERFLEGRVRIGDAEQILVRDDDQRIHMLLQLGDAGIGGAAAAQTFEAERLGDHADGQDPPIPGRLGDDRRGAGAGAAAHAGRDEAHVRALKRGLDLVDRLFRSGLADLRTGAGAEALRDAQAELDLAIGQAVVEGLSIRIGDNEVDPLNVRLDHVGDGIAAGAADPDHADPRAELLHFRTDEIDAHNQSPHRAVQDRRLPPKCFCPNRFLGASAKLTKPTSYPQFYPLCLSTESEMPQSAAATSCRPPFHPLPSARNRS